MMPQYNQQQQIQHPPDPYAPEGDEIGSSGDTSTPTSKRRKVVTAGDVAVLISAETHKPENPVTTTSDGATIEVARKPRGRPPGSKNKPKPPIVITREVDCNAMSPHVLEVSSGCDVVEAVTEFVRRRQFGLCVISGAGSVSNVTFRQPTPPGSTVTFNGCFDILSLSATYLPSATAGPSAVVNACGFTVSLAGYQGRVLGGSVVGHLRASGTVVIVAASFANPSYHRLPIEDDTSEARHQTPAPTSSTITDSSAMASVYPVCPVPMSCHLPSEIFWAPPARRPQPPY